MSLLEQTSFSEATNNFREFLAKQDLHHRVLWVFREDIIQRQNNFFIKVPVSTENEMFARKCFELGRDRNLGVCLYAFAIFADYICCYVQLPLDELDAQQLMLSKLHLKFSVKSNLTKLQPITGGLPWILYRTVYEMLNTHTDVPQRMPSKSELS